MKYRHASPRLSVGILQNESDRIAPVTATDQSGLGRSDCLPLVDFKEFY
ncbi:MAG: hypothetical protein KME50_30540 [Nostoc desertorum CM1-VF14]|nr:hypothetical protein [Nostoc desertorum CM1-VF14]